MADQRILDANRRTLSPAEREGLRWRGPARGAAAQSFAYTLVELLIVIAVVLPCGCWLLKERSELSKPVITSSAKGYNGGYAGIGINLKKDEKSGAILITRVAPDSPAAAAKLFPGLIVQTIGDTPTHGKSLLECELLIRGIAGTKVRLNMADANGNEMHLVELTRVNDVNFSS
jgi:hypothetical protein